MEAKNGIDTPFFDDPVEEEAAKLAYAAAYVANGKDKFTAGWIVFPNPEDRGKAMQAVNWFGDPIVIKEISRLNNAITLLDEIRAERRKCEDAKLKLEYFKLEAEAEGLIKKPGGTNVNIDNRQVNYHLKTPMKPATPEEHESFAARFKAQQMKLVEDARSNRPN